MRLVMPTTMIAVLVLMMVGDDVDDDNHPVGYNDHDFDTAPQISLRRKMYIV